MLMTGSPAKAIKLMKVVGLLPYVIPELVPAIKMVQNKHHSEDVFSHTLTVLSKTQPVLIQRLMGLFHDIGKTVTKSVTPTGVHFYGHEDEGSKIAEDVMTRLKYPTELVSAVKLGVRNHMRLKSAKDTGVELSDKALRKFKIEVGDQLENILNVIHADNCAHADASAMPNQIANIRKRLETLNMNVAHGKPKLPITGNDLQAMGLKPGPIYSEIMKAVTEAWYENPNISKEQALEIAKNINKKPHQSA
jgi:putative nucleotidyltransferase with HDIG domain